MSRFVLEAGAAQSDSRSREFDLRSVHARGRIIRGQLPEDGEWTYSRGLFAGFQAGFSAEHSNDGNPPGIESSRHGGSHLAALLPWPAGKQFFVFRPAADPRTIPADLYKSFHASRRHITCRQSSTCSVSTFNFFLQGSQTQ